MRLFRFLAAWGPPAPRVPPRARRLATTLREPISGEAGRSSGAISYVPSFMVTPPIGPRVHVQREVTRSFARNDGAAREALSHRPHVETVLLEAAAHVAGTEVDA